MPIGQRQTILGPSLSMNLGLRQSTSDDVDDAALALGADLLCRIDPRDVRLTADNPTGTKRVHYMAPNRDPLVMAGTGSPITADQSGVLYGGRPYFKLNRGMGVADLNNLVVGPGSMDGLLAFSFMGVAHFDAALKSITVDEQGLFTVWRDYGNAEATVYHTNAGGVHYLSMKGDAGEAGGVNHNLDTSTVFANGVPFAYLFQVTGTGPGNNKTNLFVNNLDAPLLSATNGPWPETGTMQMRIGNRNTQTSQWAGGHARGYLYRDNILDTADKLAAARALMFEMKTHYGIA